MLVDDLPLDEPFDMAECGSVVVEEVTGSLFPHLQAAEVTEVHVLRLDARQMGVQLLLGAGEAFHFWVEDDELYWGDAAALTIHDWRDELVPTIGEPVKV